MKQALVCNTSDLPQQWHDAKGMSLIPIERPIEFFANLPTLMVGRDLCETDESLQQLLPYITVIDSATYDVFYYIRGNGGEESRLHGDISVGLGGHVDAVPPDNLALWLSEEAKRELREEVAMAYAPRIWFRDMLKDDTNAVGRVHLGLHGIIFVDSKEHVRAAEAGVIEHTGWISLGKLHDDPALYNRLENWSKIVVNTFAR